jgi:hypothetical protein
MYILVDTDCVTDQDVRSKRKESYPNPQIMDYFEARLQLRLGRHQTDHQAVATSSNPKASGRIEPSLGLTRVAEQALYWLLSAPALVYLCYLAFAL